MLLVLASCGGQQEGESDITTSTAIVESTTTAFEESPTSTAPVEPEYPDSDLPGDLLDEMVADAAERTAVDRESVEIISITEETFSDASLGCPEPGEVYAQVITPGHVVIVEAGGEEFDYRVGTQSETFKLCE